MSKRQIPSVLSVPLLVLLLLTPAILSAASHEVVYLEGFPYTRGPGGEEIELDIGDIVRTGETVITGRDETVELEADGYTVYIDENTVFSLREVESRGKKTDVLSCALGKLSFTREKFLGTEPRLMTNSAVCGVRGTSVVLYAGADGSSLIVVEEGRVEIEAGGESVELGAEEGVEIVTGSTPGEIFEVKRGYIDYGEWNELAMEKLLSDPVTAAKNVASRLDDYVQEIEHLVPVLKNKRLLLEAVEEKSDVILKDEGKEARDKYFLSEVAPLRKDVTYLLLNLRYYSLSSLSLRRFVLARIYLQMKSLNIAYPGNETYRRFLDIHGDFLDTFETHIVPHLVIQDI